MLPPFCLMEIILWILCVGMPVTVMMLEGWVFIHKYVMMLEGWVFIDVMFIWLLM
jgi:hypothetical protein